MFFFFLKVEQQFSYAVLVSDLCVGFRDGCVPGSMTGRVDCICMNTNMYENISWTNSVTCLMAGFLSPLSSELAASIICMVTILATVALLPASPAVVTQLSASLYLLQGEAFLLFDRSNSCGCCCLTVEVAVVV